MAQLIVRNLEESLVQALRERAARKGRSTEAEHREILRDALAARRRSSIKAALLGMPDVGRDDDFAKASSSRSAGSPVSLLIDTNVVSELRKGDRADRHVRAWFATVSDDDIHLSVLVVGGELRRGIERVRAKDAGQAEALKKRWLQRLTRQHADRIVPVDRRVADEWGRFSATRHESPVDLLMAATARVHELTLVTRQNDGHDIASC